jgi:hypothetical protein
MVSMYYKITGMDFCSQKLRTCPKSYTLTNKLTISEDYV